MVWFLMDLPEKLLLANKKDIGTHTNHPPCCTIWQAMWTKAWCIVMHELELTEDLTIPSWQLIRLLQQHVQWTRRGMVRSAHYLLFHIKKPDIVSHIDFPWTWFNLCHKGQTTNLQVLPPFPLQLSNDMLALVPKYILLIALRHPCSYIFFFQCFLIRYTAQLYTGLGYLACCADQGESAPSEVYWSFCVLLLPVGRSDWGALGLMWATHLGFNNSGL